MEQLAVGLVCAALVGMVGVAYRFPKVYRSVYAPLLILATALLAAGIAWDTASYHTLKQTAPYIRDVFLPHAFARADEIRLGFYNLGVSYLLTALWLTILRLLPLAVPFERKRENVLLKAFSSDVLRR